MILERNRIIVKLVIKWGVHIVLDGSVFEKSCTGRKMIATDFYFSCFSPPQSVLTCIVLFLF